MTAFASNSRPRAWSAANLLRLGALLSAALALAVALGTLFAGGSSRPAGTSAAAEAAALDARIDFFEARAAADPLDFLSRNLLAAAYMQRTRVTGDAADVERAEAAATRSLELVPADNFGGLTGLAQVRLYQHDYAAVAELAASAADLKPSEPAAFGLLADAYLGLGRYEDGAAAIDRMAMLESGLPTLSRLAHLAFLEGDRINAVAFWRQAIAASEGLPIEHQAWAHSQLGQTYFALGNLSRSGNEYGRSLALYPEYRHALAGLARVRAAEGRWDEAAAFNTRAIGQLAEPEYVAALGDAYAASGRPALAEQQYAAAAAIATTYLKDGNTTDLHIAFFYADHDIELHQALTIAEESYAAGPGVYAADAVGWALFKNGRAEEAAGYAAEATALGTLEPAFYYHAAAISLALGDKTSAEAHLRRLGELNARFAPAYAEDAAVLLSGLAD